MPRTRAIGMTCGIGPPQRRTASTGGPTPSACPTRNGFGPGRRCAAAEVLRRIQAFLHRHSGVRLAGLLALPMGWVLLVYLLPLGLLFLTAFWDTDSFTGLVQRTFTTENFVDLL